MKKLTWILIAFVLAAALFGCAKSADTDHGKIVYHNADYGFDFYLPSSWKGYQIITQEWEGKKTKKSGEKTVETGPILSIRHPLWRADKPRQDIPVMVFTTAQWNALQQDKFHIGAAPVGPSELGRNSSYVFALPARYNFSFPEGYEEVEKILSNKPFKPFEITETMNQ